MNKLSMKNILLALLAVLVIFGMGIFKGQINGDRSFHRFTMEEGGNYTYTLDVGKMGIIKNLVQPNVMTLYMRFKVPADTQDLRCEVEGIECFVSQGSKKGVWKKLTPTDVLQRGKGNQVPLNLEFKVPRKNVERYNVAEGKVNFTSAGKSYAVMNVKIINSNCK